MYTRTFERTTRNGIERILISCYGFVYYLDGQVIREGCMEDIDNDIQALLDEGFEEVEV